MPKFYLLISILIISIVVSSLSFFSLFTGKWLTATATLSNGLVNHITYGLFSGTMQRTQLATRLQFDLMIVCDFDHSACMYSCQKDTRKRIEELTHIILNITFQPCEQSRQINFFQQRNVYRNVSNSELKDIEFIPPTIWLSAVIFHIVALIFSLLSVIFTLLNLYYSPIERIFNVFGLYIWNGCSFISQFLSLSLWLVLYKNHLQYNIAITDTLRKDFTFSSNGKADLGLCFYSALTSGTLSAFNIFLIRCHFKNRTDNATHVVPIANETNMQFRFY